jgi:hypothetical protein
MCKITSPDMEGACGEWEIGPVDATTVLLVEVLRRP